MITTPEQFNNQAKNTVEDMSSFARQSWDVAMKSAAVMTKGIEETTRSTSGMMQENMARAMTASKTIMGAKSLREMMDLQAEFMKESFDHLIATTSKLSELGARIAKEAMDPVAEHANASMSKIMAKTRAAA